MSTPYVDASGETRLIGKLTAPGATVGDVLTVQADGTVTPDTPSGGAQTLEEVLTAGADGGAVGMTNTGPMATGGGDVDAEGGHLLNAVMNTVSLASDLDADGNAITNLVNPSNAQDGDTKAARDAAITAALAGYTPPPPPAPALDEVLGAGADGGGIAVTNVGGVAGPSAGTFVVQTDDTSAAIIMTRATGQMKLAATRLGFYDAPPQFQQEVPAVATPQDIVDVLLNLGLVTQAS